MNRLYEFDRYVDGSLMAEGAAVHAPSEAEAIERAQRLFRGGAKPGEMDRTTFRPADAPSAGEEKTK